jgi:hypothetical protein
MWTGTPETIERSWAKEKKNMPKVSPSEWAKKSLDALKTKEQESSEQDKQDLEVLENIIQGKWSGGSKPRTPPPRAFSPRYLQYKKHITDWIVQHPERPPEVGQAALDMLDIIVNSHQNPNIVAKSLGKIMKIILNI